jgi:sulfide dehydrogenase cytochrome subunit
MCETVLHTSDERIADLAEHYANQRRGHSNEPYNSELAAKGEKIHAEHCSKCHVRPDDPAVTDALGIPLHGQRGVYLRYALQSYKDGRRKNLLDAMGEKLKQVDSDGIEALVNYYASY